MHSAVIRTHLKNVFWAHIFVGASFQILRSASGGPPVCDPSRLWDQTGNPAQRGNSARRDLEPKSYFSDGF